MANRLTTAKPAFHRLEAVGEQAEAARHDVLHRPCLVDRLPESAGRVLRVDEDLAELVDRVGEPFVDGLLPALGDHPLARAFEVALRAS